MAETKPLRRLGQTHGVGACDEFTAVPVVIPLGSNRRGNDSDCQKSSEKCRQTGARASCWCATANCAPVSGSTSTSESVESGAGFYPGRRVVEEKAQWLQ